MRSADGVCWMIQVKVPLDLFLLFYFFCDSHSNTDLFHAAAQFATKYSTVLAWLASCISEEIW